MSLQPDFELQAAHQYFSTYCFNQVWELLEKEERSSEENEEILRLSLASHWHWTQRNDYTPINASVALWQISRVHAVLGRAEEARRWAEQCLAVSRNNQLAPFYRAYAYEARARAELAAGNQDLAGSLLQEARTLAEQVDDPEEKQWLIQDLRDLQILYNNSS